MGTTGKRQYRRTHLSLALLAGSDAKLRKLAKELGYLCKRGPGSKSEMGSISGLIEAIASGDLEMVGRTKQSTGKITS